jgi:hypothetical protein
LARSSAASVPGGIAGELPLNRIPQRLIDDRRVFARMELALVNDLAAIGWRRALAAFDLLAAGKQLLRADVGKTR